MKILRKVDDAISISLGHFRQFPCTEEKDGSSVIAFTFLVVKTLVQLSNSP